MLRVLSHVALPQTNAPRTLGHMALVQRCDARVQSECRALRVRRARLVRVRVRVRARSGSRVGVGVRVGVRVRVIGLG